MFCGEWLNCWFYDWRLWYLHFLKLFYELCYYLHSVSISLVGLMKLVHLKACPFLWIWTFLLGESKALLELLS
jgi:hypothetical protein